MTTSTLPSRTTAPPTNGTGRTACSTCSIRWLRCQCRVCTCTISHRSAGTLTKTPFLCRLDRTSTLLDRVQSGSALRQVLASWCAEAIRQHELLDSGASREATVRPRLQPTRSALSEKHLRTSPWPARMMRASTHREPSSGLHARASSSGDSKRISRVPVPTTLLSPPPPPHPAYSAPRNRRPISPVDSSLLSTSLWSKTLAPDTPLEHARPAVAHAVVVGVGGRATWPISARYAVEPSSRRST